MFKNSDFAGKEAQRVAKLRGRKSTACHETKPSTKMFGFIGYVSNGREGSEVGITTVVERISGGDGGRWSVV